MKQTRTIISIGGSIIIPKTGWNPVFLRALRRLLVRGVAAGYTFVLVIGGGATARSYQTALKESMHTTDSDLDEIGIATTRANAEFVRLLLKDIAYETVTADPFKKITTKKQIIVACGWKPGSSTDLRAVQLAKTYGAQRMINASNIDYVYTKDPRRFKDAKKITDIRWKDFQYIVGTVWSPGSNVPFDPIATKLAKTLRLEVDMVNGTNLAQLARAIEGKQFIGTKIF